MKSMVAIFPFLPGPLTLGETVCPSTPMPIWKRFMANPLSSPTYYRMSTDANPVEYPVQFGKLAVVKEGHQATVIAVGPALSRVLSAVSDLDVSVLYCTTVAPFDAETLQATCQGNSIILLAWLFA